MGPTSIDGGYFPTALSDGLTILASLAILPPCARVVSLPCDEEHYVGRLVLALACIQHPAALASVALAAAVAAPPDGHPHRRSRADPHAPHARGLPSMSAGGRTRNRLSPDPHPRDALVQTEKSARRAQTHCDPGLRLSQSYMCLLSDHR